MYYVARCVEPTVFDWSSTLLEGMKAQLTTCRMGKKKTFGYGSILLSLFFERVPGMSPRVDFGPHAMMIPTMGRSTSLMFRLGGGQLQRYFDDEYFGWWSRQIVALEDYPYAGIDFSQYPNMVVPLGNMIGALGKSFCILNIFSEKALKLLYIYDDIIFFEY